MQFFVRVIYVYHQIEVRYLIVIKNHLRNIWQEFEHVLGQSQDLVVTKIEDLELLITFDFTNRHFGEAFELLCHLEYTPVNRQTLLPIICCYAIINFIALFYLAVLASRFIIFLRGFNKTLISTRPSLLITKPIFIIPINHLPTPKRLYFGNLILRIVFIELLELAIGVLNLRLKVVLLGLENLRRGPVHAPRFICSSIPCV